MTIYYTNSTTAETTTRLTRPALYSVAETVRRNSSILTEGRLRSYIHAAEDRQGANGIIRANGFARAIIRIGRRIFIDEDALFDWIEASQSRSATRNANSKDTENEEN